MPTMIGLAASPSSNKSTTWRPASCADTITVDRAGTGSAATCSGNVTATPCAGSATASLPTRTPPPPGGATRSVTSILSRSSFVHSDSIGFPPTRGVGTAASALVLLDLAAFDRHVRICLGIDLTRGGDGDILSLDGDSAILLQGDRSVAGHQLDLLARVQRELLPHLELVVLADICRACIPNRERFLFSD